MAETKKKSNSTARKRSNSGTKKTSSAAKKPAASAKSRASKSTAKTASKSNTREKRTYERKPQDIKVRNEIKLIVTAVISFLLILSLLNVGGAFGKVFNMIVFGLFGRFAYVFPFALFGAVFYIVNSDEKYIATDRIVLCSVGSVLICALIHSIVVFDSSTILKSFSLGYKEKTGGGFFGALVSYPLGKLFGKLGSRLIIIAGIIIVLIVMTRKAIFTIITQKTQEEYKDLSERHRENKERRERERLERSAEEGRISYESMLSDRPRIYKAGVSDEGASKKTRENASFIDKLKSGEAYDAKTESVPEPAKKPVPVPKPDIKDEVSKINHELDMIEITGLDDQTFDKPEYQKEMERKFGDKSKTSEEVFEAPSGSVLTERDDDHEPVIINNGNKNVPSGTGYTPVNVAASAVVPSVKPEVRPEIRPEVRPEIRPAADTNHAYVKPTPADNAVGGPMLIKKAEKPKPKKPYVFPPMSLLAKPPAGAKGTTNAELKETARKLQETLKSFGVNVTITNISCGPTVTRYELQPEVGVKVSKITSLSDDIKLNLAASDIRMEAPIPGKSAIGIEVPNKVNQTVFFSSLAGSEEFKSSKSNLTFAVGKDIGGQVIVSDIAKMPHLLIAGATGSGKSVCINTLIMSLLYKADPDDVKLILVDPKVVELSVYNGLPHLLIPVVTDAKKASGALNWAVMEMTDRYKKFADLGVRDLAGYNKKVLDAKGELKGSSGEIYEKLPQIVFVIDELADLMMVAPGEVEDYIIRITQLARACGIHLIIATQRPSVNVITGLIKANVPSRIAFSVASQVDSRTILDMAGAEKLLGKGDMLFYPMGYTKPIRVQGAFISDSEVIEIVEYIKAHNSETDTTEMEQKVNASVSQISSAGAAAGGPADNGSDNDELIFKAGMFIIEKEKASIGSLQRQFKIGFNRAARIMDQLAEAGVVGPEEGTKPRQILMTAEAFSQYASENGLTG